MRIACLGGGPAGIYFALSMKLRDPSHEIHVFERNASGDTFGWGVVFSDQTLENLKANDPVSAAAISDSFAYWDDIEVNVEGRSEISSGHGFIGIGRKRILQILQQRAADLGVIMHFETEFDPDLSQYSDFDLIVGADGVNSRIRTAHEDKFGVDIQTRRNRFCWLGTTQMFDAFAFIFEKTEHGWIWAHAYRFDETHSTFIVECSPETWEAIGFDKMEQAESIALCEKIFARHLGGHPLITNATHLRGSAAWINFRRVICHKWSFDNVVLLGDAAHTAHFSIGSGTKLALEDAIKLAEVLDRPGLNDRDELAAALAEYQEERHVEVLKIQNSARNSTEWFEVLERYLPFELPQFAYSLMTRSQRVSHENLRLRDAKWVADLERSYWAGNEGRETPVRPMFTPYALRDLALANRVVVPPMLTYRADDRGMATSFHAVHYGSRALGGAGLVMTEMLATAPEGRMTESCPGLWSEEQVAAWRDICIFARENGGARMGCQIGHAGPRGLDLPDAPMLAASAKPWSDGDPVPAAMDRGAMDAVRDGFVAAARRAIAAGFDLLELQAAHGTLLASFISPILNERTDEYGGGIENRMRFPLEVVTAVRAAWSETRPMAVRISAHDWVEGKGVTHEDIIALSRALKEAGVDIIDVSTGETSPDAKPVYGRMFQVPFADEIRNTVNVPVITVGNITSADQANSILMAGRADLVAIGRPHLVDPAWTLRAAAEAGERGVSVPEAYRLGQDQARRLAARAAELERA